MGMKGFVELICSLCSFDQILRPIGVIFRNDVRDIG